MEKVRQSWQKVDTVLSGAEINEALCGAERQTTEWSVPRRCKLLCCRSANLTLVPPPVALEIPRYSPINAFIMGASWPLSLIPTLSMSQPELPILFPPCP